MKRKWMLIGAAALILCFAVGCPSPEAPPIDSDIATVTSIAVTPAEINVIQGGNQTFTATVYGTGDFPQTVTWAIVEAGVQSGTAIVKDNATGNGVLTVDIDETVNHTLTIRAYSTLTGSTHKYGEAIVTVLDDTAVTVTGITITPHNPSVEQGETEIFTAAVVGANSPAQDVTWTIVETDVQTDTKIVKDNDTEKGVLTVDIGETVGRSLTIQAHSTLTGYTHIPGQVTVTVVAPGTVTVDEIIVSPATETVNQGDFAIFTAEVKGKNDPSPEVTWSIVEQATVQTGTAITKETDGTGKLTVAANETLGKTLTIRATSTVTNYLHRYGDATVTVTDPNPPPAKVWLVGDINNWGDGTPIEIESTSYGVFIWSGDFTANSYLKFYADNNTPINTDDDVWFTPMGDANVAVDCVSINTFDTKNFVKGADKPNVSWQIVDAGAYTITINYAASTVTFARTADLIITLTDIWLASDITNVWEPPFDDAATKFTKTEDGKYTWTGTFPNTTTYLKFYTLSNVGGNYFEPTENTAVTKDIPESMSVFAPNSSWASWTWATAGIFKIVIDPAAKTFVITDPAPEVTGITVSPSRANVAQGGTEQFTATVQGIGTITQSVKWTIVEESLANGTTINEASGELTVGLTETPERTLTIRATSQFPGFTHITGDATVTVKEPSSGIVESVAILVNGSAPSGQVEVERGQTQTFTVSVQVSGDASPEVEWSIVEAGKDAGTIITKTNTTTSSLAISFAEKLTTLTIKATAVDDGSISNTVQVKVVGTDIWLMGSAASLGLSGSDAWNYPNVDCTTDARKFEQKADGTYEKTLTASGTFYFRFYKTSTKTGGAAATQLEAESGNLIFSSNVSNPMRQGSINAWMGTTSNSNGPFKFIINQAANTFILQVPPVVSSVSVSSLFATVNQGEELQFNAVVNGQYSPPQTVTWSIAGAGLDGKTAAGSEIDANGLLTASETEPVGTSLTIRATSTENTGISGTATVTVRPAAGAPVVYGVTISPSVNVQVKQGKTLLFTALVDGAGGANPGVTWSIVETLTTTTAISSSTGVLTVASNETPRTITVRATPLEPGFTDEAADVTVTIIPFVASGYNVWLVGESPPNTWQIPVVQNGPNQMTDEGDGVFSWTGDLKTASTNQGKGVTFVTSRNNTTPNWGTGYWWTSPSNGVRVENIPTAQTFSIRNNSGEDFLWNIVDAGRYTITLNTTAMTVTFVKNN